jgi:hypothetical protein
VLFVPFLDWPTSHTKVGVYNNTRELQKLRLREKSFPGTSNLEEAKGIIGVHHNVYPGIEKCPKVGVSARKEIETRPPCPCNGCVMIDMKERYLVKFTSKNHEVSVKKLKVLVAIMHPYSISSSR